MPVLLAGVCFIEEMSSGAPVAGAASVREEFQTDYATLTLLVFVAPFLFSLFFEAPLLMLADRWSRKRMATAAMVAMALCLAGAGFATDAWMFAGALALWSTATGVAAGVAEAMVVDSDPENRELRMGEWTLAGILGDIAGPAVLAGAAYLSLSWRAGFFATAAIVLFWAVRFGLTRFEDAGSGGGDEDDGAREDPAREDPAAPKVRLSLVLFLWLFACSLCSLLDETLVAFAVMFTRDVLGGGEIAQSTMVAMFSSGAAVGVALMPRALARLKPLALLAWTSVACTVAYSAWLFSTALVPATVLIFAAGMTVGPLYPLAKAQAFRALPERSGLVNALNAAFTPLDIVLPYGIGYVADTYGIRWALAILVLQPIGLGLIALIEVRRARRSSGSAAA